VLAHNTGTFSVSLMNHFTPQKSTTMTVKWLGCHTVWKHS